MVIPTIESFLFGFSMVLNVILFFMVLFYRHKAMFITGLLDDENLVITTKKYFYFKL